MSTLQIMPFEARERRFQSLQSAAEEATLVVPKHKNVLHFIESNTQEATINHLKNDCIVPVFSKDNELTVSHAAFIETVGEAVQNFFSGERIEQPDIRVSHIIKGRVPSAIHKPASQLQDSDRTIYYERCAFAYEVPSIQQIVEGNKLNLTITGVRAFNRENLYSRKTVERFSIGIGFKNLVCCNLCLFTDGLKNDIRVSDTTQLFKEALELFQQYNPNRHLQLMREFGSHSLTQHQFAQILGKMRLYQSLPSINQRKLPPMLMTDSQINQVARAYVNDENFYGYGRELSMWRFYNLLTGSNKSSYIDTYLDRALNATDIAQGITSALQGDDAYRWFID